MLKEQNFCTSHFRTNFDAISSPHTFCVDINPPHTSLYTREYHRTYSNVNEFISVSKQDDDSRLNVWNEKKKVKKIKINIKWVLCVCVCP